MKVLKDPNQVLRIMRAKLDELRKKFDEAEDELEEAEIYGQKTSIICVKSHIRRAIKYHHRFDGSDMAGVYKYAADTKRSAREYGNPWDTWYMKGRAEGTAWALKEIEKEDEVAMTDEEWNERIAKEKKAREDAIGLLCQALQKAGVPLYSLEIIERDSDRRVKATFTWGVRYADISMDAPHTALWDILRQIPELR